MASSDALPGPRRPRPLSPHLSIYRPTMTMAMSIAHRISGGALYVGGGTVTLANDTLESNVATYGGALYVAGGTVTLTNDTVESNYAEFYAGGISIVSRATVYLDSFTVANTINNTDSTGMNGSTANIDGTYILQ